MLPGRKDRHWGGKPEYWPDGTRKGLGGGNQKSLKESAAGTGTAQRSPSPPGQPSPAATPQGSPAARPAAQAPSQGAAGAGAASGTASGSATGAIPRTAAAPRGDPMSNPLINHPEDGRLPAFRQLTNQQRPVPPPDLPPEFAPRQQQPPAAVQPAEQLAMHREPYPVFLSGHIEQPPNAYYQVPQNPIPVQPHSNVIYTYPPPGFVAAEQVFPYPGQPQYVQPVLPLQSQPYNYYPPPPNHQQITPPHAMYQQPVPSAPPLSALVQQQPASQPVPVQSFQQIFQPPPTNARFPINEYPPLPAAGHRRPPTPHPEGGSAQRRSVPMEGVEPTQSVPRAPPQQQQQPQPQASSQPGPSAPPSRQTYSSLPNPNTHEAHVQATNVHRLTDQFLYKGQIFRLEPKTSNTQGAPSQIRTNPNARPTQQTRPQPEPMEVQPSADSQPHHSTLRKSKKGKGKGKGSSNRGDKRKAERGSNQSPPSKKPKDTEGTADQPYQLTSSDDDFVTR